MESLVLIANPGSASRKYAVYKSNNFIASLHYETSQEKIVCTLKTPQYHRTIDTDVRHFDDAAQNIRHILIQENILSDTVPIARIALRVVAPSSYFLEDRLLESYAIELLQKLKTRAPLHIRAILHEYQLLKAIFPDTPIIGISDSAFHAHKEDSAWNYAIGLHDADTHDIKRFGYHGLSVESVIERLQKKGPLPEKIIVCHLGSGCSVTAVKNATSTDTTMGFSPLEGMMMATRSGTIDPVAYKALKDSFGIDDDGMIDYLSNHSGLLGISGISSDIRDLLEPESRNDYRAGLALTMYVGQVKQAIARMAAVLGGIDALVFTGTVGERSAIIRARVMEDMEFIGLGIETEKNLRITSPLNLVLLSSRRRQKKVYVAPTDEMSVIAQRTNSFII